jgi:hypothetical protein
MGSRVILPYGESGEYIQKIIPHNSTVNIELPSFDEYLDTCSLNLEGISQPELRTAIEQQYNEWFTWYTATEDTRRLLAPIVGTGWSEDYFPILYFPRFMPLLNDDLVHSLNNNENLIIMGMRLQPLNVSEEEVTDFLREIPIVCNYLNLNEEDIINNPSNIGYNLTFGLRIIDYGLST